MSNIFSKIIIEQLLELGIDHFFGVPGGAIAPIYNVLYDYKDKIKIINVKHETMAMFMAKGYFLTTGKIACVLTTSGPGITNSLTGLISANLEHIPVLLMSGEVPTSKFNKNSLQDGGQFNVVDAIQTMNIFSIQVKSQKDLNIGLQHLLNVKKPVFISLPLDVSSSKISSNDYNGLQLQNPENTIVDEIKLQETIQFLKSNKNGVIFVGSGAIEAKEQILELSKKINYKIVSTPKQKMLFSEQETNFVGVFGFGGHISAKTAIEKSEFILFIGTGFSEVATNNWSKILDKNSVKIDSKEFSHHIYQHKIEIVGNIKNILNIINKKFPQTNHENTNKENINIIRFEEKFDNINGLHPISIIEELQKLAPENTLWSSDIGEHLLFAIHYLKSEKNQKFIAGLNFGSMGSGIGMSIGAKIDKQNPVISLCGDYGFQMFGMELSTCVQYGINVIFAVLNDSRMGMVENGLNHTYSRHLDLTTQPINFAKIAEGIGAIGLRIEKTEDFIKYKDIIFSNEKPVVLDILTQKVKFKNNERVNEITSFSHKEKE